MRESAASGGLKVGGVTTEAVAQMMLLQVSYYIDGKNRLRDPAPRPLLATGDELTQPSLCLSLACNSMNKYLHMMISN